MPEVVSAITTGSAYERSCVEFLGMIVEISKRAASEGDDLTVRALVECLLQLAECRSKLFKIHGVAQNSFRTDADFVEKS
jgi:hypothetical protein